MHAAARSALDGGCDPVCVVTGHGSGEVETAVSDLPLISAHNGNWQHGMGSSIRAGLAAVGNVEAIVILACDQPAVTGGTVASILDLHRESRKAIVASSYAGTLGIPALFDRDCFDELFALSDSKGAKSLIEADPGRVAVFGFPGGALDLDTPEDLEAWRGGDGHMDWRGAASRLECDSPS